MAEPNDHASSTGHEMAAPDWLDRHFLAMQPEYEEMLRWVGLEPGWHVLDAACGSGSFLPLMTALVGSEGRVSAIDLAPENIEVVKQRADDESWPAAVDARIGSILELPYADDTFDAVWCANTTQYLSDEELRTMLAEFVRVTRVGGIVAIKEFDATALQIQPIPPTAILRIYETLCENGRDYFCYLLRAIGTSRWLRNAGLIDLQEKPTLMIRHQPIDENLKHVLSGLFDLCYREALTLNLPPEEVEIWQALADVDDSAHIFHDPAFHFRAIQTVFRGRVPT